ncbi:MAG TPA: YetF domain-containing protein [Chthonomonadaceae bacterium]|nr:YetF domain-containing protein [Chthonomonadaceae bacterium]
MRSLVPVAIHTICIYLFLIVALRLIGRRLTGQLTVVDLTVIILLGSAVETAMVAGDVSLPAGLVSAGILLILNRLLTLLVVRSKRLRHLLGIGPVLLVQNGHFLEDHLRRVGLSEADVLEAIREREKADLSDVRFAVMEPDGEINVITQQHFAEAQPDLKEGGSGGKKKR